MQFLSELLTHLWRIAFRRGSPERLYYTRRLFIVTLLLTLVASAAVQYLYFADPITFVVLRVFAEITCFMVMIVLLTAKIARFRLARMMLVLVLLNLVADTLLLGLVPLQWVNEQLMRDMQLPLALAVGAIAVYGAGSVMAWGLNKTLLLGVGVILLYVLAVNALDSTFRGLFNVMVAG